MTILTRSRIALTLLTISAPFLFGEDKEASPPQDSKQNQARAESAPPRSAKPANQPAGPNALVPKPSEPAQPSVTTPAPATGGAAPANVTTTRRPVSPMDVLLARIPLGKTHEGVRYPLVDVDKLTGFVRSERVTRISDSRLQFEDATINQFGDDPVTFELIVGIFDKDANILQSSQPVVIKTGGYRIEGDTFNYDRATEESKMSGRVRMTIFETPETLGDADKKHSQEGDAAAGESQPASAPTNSESKKP